MFRSRWMLNVQEWFVLWWKVTSLGWVGGFVVVGVEFEHFELVASCFFRLFLWCLNGLSCNVLACCWWKRICLMWCRSFQDGDVSEYFSLFGT